MIYCRHVSKLVGDTYVLCDVHFRVSAPIVGVLGAHGSGKTTLLHVLCGIQQPTVGDVLLDGHVLSSLPLDKRQQIGLCPQDMVLPHRLSGLSYLVHIGMIRGLSRRDAHDQAIHLLQSLDIGEAIEHSLGTLSYGTARLFSVASAFMGHTSWIFLDEPAAGLDPRSLLRLDYFIKSHGKGKQLVIASHCLDLLEKHCDHAIVLSKGHRILDIPMRHIRNHSKVINVRLEKVTKRLVGDLYTISGVEKIFADMDSATLRIHQKKECFGQIVDVISRHHGVIYSFDRGEPLRDLYLKHLY